MRRGVGTIAWSSAAVGVIVLVLAGFAARGPLVEAWHLWELDSTTGAERFRAAKRLGELRSTKAIPGLIELLKTVPAADAAARKAWGPGANAGDCLVRVLGAMGSPVVAPLAGAIEESRGEKTQWRRYACRALGETRSEAAIPPLVAALDDQDACVRMTAYHVLGSMGAEAREAVPAITSHLGDRQVFIRAAAAQALRLIAQAGNERVASP